MWDSLIRQSFFDCLPEFKQSVDFITTCSVSRLKSWMVALFSQHLCLIALTSINLVPVDFQNLTFPSVCRLHCLSRPRSSENCFIIDHLRWRSAGRAGSIQTCFCTSRSSEELGSQSSLQLLRLQLQPLCLPLHCKQINAPVLRTRNIIKSNYLYFQEHFLWHQGTEFLHRIKKKMHQITHIWDILSVQLQGYIIFKCFFI